MLQLKVNEKLLQSHLSKETGQVVLLKDLHNLSSLSKEFNEDTVEKALEEARKTPGMRNKLY